MYVEVGDGETALPSEDAVLIPEHCTIGPGYKQIFARPREHFHVVCVDSPLQK